MLLAKSHSRAGPVPFCITIRIGRPATMNGVAAAPPPADAPVAYPNTPEQLGIVDADVATSVHQRRVWERYMRHPTNQSAENGYYYRLNRREEQDRKGEPWSAQEDNVLKESVRTKGTHSRTWGLIGRDVPGRCGYLCRDRCVALCGGGLWPSGSAHATSSSVQVMSVSAAVSPNTVSPEVVATGHS